MEKQFKRCNIHDLWEAMQASDACQVLDVREAPELASERIEGIIHAPLSSFEKTAASLDPYRPVYLMCRTGARSRDAASRLLRLGFSDVYVVEGGITEWIEAGKPVIRGKVRVWSLERQVRFTAGLFILLGISLSLILHPYFIYLAVVVGAGLVFSALTDTCGMALLLVKMPWNRTQKTRAYCGIKTTKQNKGGQHARTVSCDR